MAQRRMAASNRIADEGGHGNDSNEPVTENVTRQNFMRQDLHGQHGVSEENHVPIALAASESTTLARPSILPNDSDPAVVGASESNSFDIVEEELNRNVNPNSSHHSQHQPKIVAPQPGFSGAHDVIPSPSDITIQIKVPQGSRGGDNVQFAFGGMSYQAVIPPGLVAGQVFHTKIKTKSTIAAQPDVPHGSEQPLNETPQALFDKTVRLMKRRDFQSADPRTLQGLVKRLSLIHEAGMPRMRVLPGKVLEELGRIPRSTEMRENGEPYNVDALEAIQRDGDDGWGKPNAVIVFFSHRWLQANYSTLYQRDVVWGSAEYLETDRAPGHYTGKPDNDGNDKLRDLLEWMRWYKWRTTIPPWNRGNHNCKECCKYSSETVHVHGFLSDYVSRNCSDLYFFIDWSCVDQTNPVAEIASLPAFVSSCTMIASYFTEEYKGRAWCQAELLMARAFCALPVVMRVPQDFKHEKQDYLDAMQFTLPDPSDETTSVITNNKDRPTIEALTKCARDSKAFTYFRCLRNLRVAYVGAMGKNVELEIENGLGSRIRNIFRKVGSRIKDAQSTILVMFWTLGLMPFIFRRNLVPGKSAVLLVEPCQSRMPNSWTQIKLHFLLSANHSTWMMNRFVYAIGWICLVYYTAGATQPGGLAEFNGQLMPSRYALISVNAITILESALQFPSIMQNQSPAIRAIWNNATSLLDFPKQTLFVAGYVSFCLEWLFWFGSTFESSKSGNNSTIASGD